MVNFFDSVIQSIFTVLSYNCMPTYKEKSKLEEGIVCIWSNKLHIWWGWQEATTNQALSSHFP